MKRAIILIAITLLIVSFVALHLRNKIYEPNVTKSGMLYIPSNANFEQSLGLINPFLENTQSFKWVAKQKNLDRYIKPGKYKIDEKMSNNEVINLLRSGKQSPVRLTFNNQDSLEKLASRVSQQIEADSISLISAFYNPEFLEKHNFNFQNAIDIYIPNTYQFFWNTSAIGFRNRMLREYQRFWTQERLDKANKLRLTPKEVITLASIVQKETSHVPERRIVAGLYLNRLKANWNLQADPTVIFALKQTFGDSISVKRVLSRDLKTTSAYNTYLCKGLPPGPISMPDISSIDAVLNPALHNYYFMCASTTEIGEHVFAKTNRQHQINARKYHRWLNKQGLKR